MTIKHIPNFRKLNENEAKQTNYRLVIDLLRDHFGEFKRQLLRTDNKNELFKIVDQLNDTFTDFDKETLVENRFKLLEKVFLQLRSNLIYDSDDDKLMFDFDENNMAKKIRKLDFVTKQEGKGVAAELRDWFKDINTILNDLGDSRVADKVQEFLLNNIKKILERILEDAIDDAQSQKEFNVDGSIVMKILDEAEDIIENDGTRGF